MVDGGAIRRRREDAGWSAQALESRTVSLGRRVAESTITRVEREGCGFPGTIAALAAALGVPVADLRADQLATTSDALS